jgi:Skp family chaperone for outer membrane proteins
MRLSLLISLSLLLLSWQPARAQFAPADDFFNSGAQFYISNNIPSALEKVESGLKIYPDDEKLKKLEALLKQNQSQQNLSSQKNQQQQNSQTQQKPEEQKQDQSGQKNSEQQKQSEQQKSAAEKKNGGKPENQNDDGQPVASGQMTPEEAKRLLDAQKGNEQVLQLKPKGSPHNSNRPFKDW